MSTMKVHIKLIKTITLLFIILFSSYTTFGAKIIFNDGTSIKNVTNIQDSNDYFICQKNQEYLTFRKSNIDEILDDDGNQIFKSRDLTALKSSDEAFDRDTISFYVNDKKVGKGVWRSNGKFDIAEGEVPDGIYKQYFSSGNIRYKYPIKDNELNGIVKKYYDSGKLHKKSKFVDGYEEGVSKIYYPDGSLKGKSNYEYGKKEGPTTLYYKNGEVKSKMSFRNGKAEGLQKMFYPNGQVSIKVHYKNGKKHGPLRKYYKNGNLEMKGQLKNGKLDGTVILYYESGNIKEKKHFSMGEILKAD